MNVAKVLKKHAQRETPVLVDLLGERSFYSSNLLLIEDTTFSPATLLLKRFQRDALQTLTIEASKVARIELNSDKTFIIVKDATVELLSRDGNGQDDQMFIQALFRLSRAHPKCTIIVDLQVDILPPERVAAVRYLADTVLTVTCLHRGSLNIEALHKLPNSKIRRENLILQNNEFYIQEKSPLSSSSAEGEASTANKNLPASTFNLQLTPEQASAKTATVLPHFRAQLSLNETINSGASYRSILAEDYDEEDPDGDLDI